MEYYLKEDNPVNNNWLKDNLGWLEEGEENKILNMSLIDGIYTNYSNFEQIVHLPNSDSIMNRDNTNLMTILNKFLDNCNDNLKYYLSTTIDNKNMIINIFLLPMVESA